MQLGGISSLIRILTAAVTAIEAWYRATPMCRVLDRTMRQGQGMHEVL